MFVLEKMKCCRAFSFQTSDRRKPGQRDSTADSAAALTAPPRQPQSDELRQTTRHFMSIHAESIGQLKAGAAGEYVQMFGDLFSVRFRGAGQFMRRSRKMARNRVAPASACDTHHVRLPPQRACKSVKLPQPIHVYFS
jgi:hypothetical protein